jgi:hypothetical protein
MLGGIGVQKIKKFATRIKNKKFAARIKIKAKAQLQIIVVGQVV